MHKTYLFTNPGMYFLFVKMPAGRSALCYTTKHKGMYRLHSESWQQRRITVSPCRGALGLRGCPRPGQHLLTHPWRQRACRRAPPGKSRGRCSKENLLSGSRVLFICQRIYLIKDLWAYLSQYFCHGLCDVCIF